MLTNLNEIGLDNKDFSGFDVALIGAGAAGITLAHKLSLNGQHVALIEGGDYDYSEESQEVYNARIVGDPYFELNVARLRFFGGTTNHWEGWCRSFDTVDFDRGYLGAEYEWPISKSEIDGYKKEACNILEIPDVFKDSPIEGSNIQEISFNFSPPVRFRDKYFNELRNHDKVHVFLNANLMDIRGGSNRIEVAEFEGFSGKKTTIKANKYVFCMGGIENSRYLLWFKEKYGDQFFSNNPALGKYWMEHPYFELGQAIVDKSKVKERFYSLKGEQQKKQSILNCGFRVEHLNDHGTKALIREILCLAPTLGAQLVELAGKNLVCGATFLAAWEQAPHIENKILLDTEIDRFGIPKPILYWHKYPIDRETVVKSVAEFNRWLLDINGGRLQLSDWVIRGSDYPENDHLAGYHHMGGTRMHSKPEFGVVDANCKVFGSDNLYIAGSSIFTTGGHNNPTLPIVQFALRLADHLSI